MSVSRFVTEGRGILWKTVGGREAEDFRATGEAVLQKMARQLSVIVHT